MKRCDRNPKPGWGQDQAPSTVVNTPDGRTAVWFRPEAASKPERYDYSVPHRGGNGWRVYFLLLCILLVPLCCVARLIARFAEGGVP